jgi:ABC-2 type transport system permease protein
MLRNILKRATFFEFLKFFIFTLIAIFFFLGLYVGFQRILAYLQTVPLIGKTLTLKLLAMVFLLFFLMLIFSSLITSLTTFFFAKDLSFLFLTPLPPKIIFVYKFLHTIFYSSWMVGITLLPLLLAYGYVEKLNLSFYLSILFLSLPFFLLASSAGVVIALFLIYLFPSPRLRNIFFIFTVFLGGIIYLLIRLLQPEQLANPDKLTEVIQYITFIQAPTAVYLPSWWITGAINAYTTANFADFRFYSLLLFSCGLAIFFLVYFLAQRIYFPAWINLQGASHLKRNKLQIPDSKLQIADWERLLNRKQPILVKDMKTFFRDTNQWVQIFLLIPLLLVYLFNLYRLPLDTFYLKNLIAFLNIGLAGFVVSAVALRFAFPAISLEGQNFWILRAAPIETKKIIYTKFLFAFLPLIFFALLIAVFSNIFLKVENIIFLFSTLVILISALVLTGLALGLGAIYPKFKVENIPQIETSQGGIFYILSALFYIGLCLGLLAWPIRMYFYHKLGKINPYDYPVIFWIFFSFFLLSLLTFFLPIFWGIRKLNNLEE